MEIISSSEVYEIKSFHIAEKLRLKDLKKGFSGLLIDFSNYEMVVTFEPNSLIFIYNYGVIVFFNVPKAEQERILKFIWDLFGNHESNRDTISSDDFLLEVESKAGTKVFFDKVLMPEFSHEAVKIVCMLLAESTALGYFETLIEDLLLKTNHFAKSLRKTGTIAGGTKNLIQFIGLCLDTKQEIIANLYIVDSPDEIWENATLDKIHQELKFMLEIVIRYRALEYKIKIIQESIQIIAELTQSRREVFLELVIICLIAFEVIISLVKY